VFAVFILLELWKSPISCSCVGSGFACPLSLWQFFLAFSERVVDVGSVSQEPFQPLGIPRPPNVQGFFLLHALLK